METLPATPQTPGHSLTWADVYGLIGKFPKGRYFGVPRGGAIVAGLTGAACSTPEEADYIVDDVVDSGKTRMDWVRKFPDKPFIALVDKERDKGLGWVKFPWEHETTRDLEDNVRRLIEGIGEDPNREGLQKTPHRVVKALFEITSGYRTDPDSVLGTTFEAGTYDQMVICKGIEFASTCEHHMLPFIGTCHVGYIPKARVVGLSKIPRLVDCFAKRLQIQEKLTEQIARTLARVLEPEGVGVIIEAKHLCVRCRGVQKIESSMITSSLLGMFRLGPVRMEFIELLKL